MLLKESVDTENQCLNLVSLDEEGNKQPDLRGKNRQGAEGLQLSEPPKKTHPTGQFVILA